MRSPLAVGSFSFVKTSPNFSFSSVVKIAKFGQWNLGEKITPKAGRESFGYDHAVDRLFLLAKQLGLELVRERDVRRLGRIDSVALGLLADDLRVASTAATGVVVSVLAGTDGSLGDDVLVLADSGLGACIADVGGTYNNSNKKRVPSASLVEIRQSRSEKLRSLRRR